MVHGKQRNAKKMRNLRCKSADSGVSCTLNKNKNNLLQQDVVQTSRLELNGLDGEEDLDFEPDHEDQSQLLINSDESTVKIYSDGRDGDNFSNASVENNSTSTASIGHRREMLLLPRSDAKDGRESEYLSFTYPTNMRRILDSSSDDASTESDVDDNVVESEGDFSRNQNIDCSGDLDHDDNDSMCDMTQEEEDRLLSSNDEATYDDDETHIEGEPTEDDVDEDEEIPHTETELTKSNNFKHFSDEDEEPYLEKIAVKTCHFGNARITLPTFFKKTHVDTFRPRANDLKRTTSAARSHKLETKKKKKWDLQYSPEVPPIRLFMEDLGFVAESSPDEDEGDREFDRGGSVQSVPKFIVICNDKDKVVRQTNQNEMQRETLQMPKQEGDLFKLPLPPPKRPPTRPKRMVVSDSEESSKNIQIKISSKDAGTMQRPDSSFVFTKSGISRGPRKFQDETASSKFDTSDKDDSISIIASTIGGDNIEDIADLSQMGSKESSSAFEYEQVNETKSESLKSLSAEERVQNWIQNVPASMPPQPPPLMQLEVTQPQFSAAPQISPLTVKGNNRIYFGDVPNLFSGMCYHHYLNGYCVRKCNLLHCIVRNKFTYKFKSSNPEKLSKAYDYALKFERLYKDIYPCFMAAFAHFKMQKNLVASIEHIFKMDSVDKTEALEIIVGCLENSGLSFLESIEMISFNFGFFQNPELGDILLDLITRKQDISENWDFIKRIGRARGQISPEIVKRILSRVTSVYPLDKHLCLEIYNVIIKNEMTDLSQISEEHLAPLRTLAGFRDMTDATVKVAPRAPLIRPITIPHNTELLAAHIDNNLIKEREKYEREVEGRTVRMTTVPSRPKVLPQTFINSYEYDARNITMNYDNFHHSSDSDDRYFTPPVTHDSFLPPINDRYVNPFLGGGMFSKASSSASNESLEHNSGSPRNVMLFEPPPPLGVSQYVPETVQMIDNRNEPMIRNNNSPIFPSGQMELPLFRSQDLDITLTPSRPIFGNPRFRNDFTLDSSVHNLLPDTDEHVNINERDIVLLNKVIKSKNGAEFNKLLQRYKGPATIRNFITMMIAHLKTCNDMSDVLMGLIESLEKIKPDYAKDKLIKAVVEVVVMNLLFEFERRGLWCKARKILETFCDWDSLISSQIFATRRVTTMGRYIFLAKIFTKSHNFHYTYEILQCPNLHLLESCDQWPYFYNAQADVEQRKVVLTEFFTHGHRYSIVDISDMYRRIFKYGGIHGFEAQRLFNPMLISLMNEQQTSKLKHFHPDIDIYYKAMDKNVLRAFTILLSTLLNEEDLHRLYELCCERQIYTHFQGGETNITVRNNMMDAELQLILSYYFNKILSTRRLPPGNLTISIKLLESQVHYPKILQKCCRSISEINESVRRILRDNFNICVYEATQSKFTDIEIKFEQIQEWARTKDMYCYPNYW